MKCGIISCAIITVGLLGGPRAPAAHAQIWERLTNPKSNIVVTHPPRVTLKGITKISVLELTGSGRCGAEFGERIATLIGQSSRFELIDRSNIEAVLREQGFQSSGAVTPSAAVKLGAMLGPSAAFAGRVLRCNVATSGPLYSDYQDSKGRVTRTYMRRTTAQLSARINLIDLATGKVLAGEMVEASDTLVNSSVQGDPEAPSADAVLTNVYRKAENDVSRILFPWTETISVSVHDDNKCELKASAGEIRNANFEAAAERLRVMIDKECDHPEDKVLRSKAYYNRGIALTYSGKPRDGLESLQRASALRSTGITDEAISAVQQLMALDAQRARANANALDLTAPAATIAAQPQAGLLTNREILELVKAKMSDAIVISSLRNAPCKLDVSPSALIAMKQAGASNALLLEMTDAGAKRCK